MFKNTDVVTSIIIASKKGVNEKINDSDSFLYFKRRH